VQWCQTGRTSVWNPVSIGTRARAKTSPSRGLTIACKRPPIASAPPSLRLLAAPEAQRECAKRSVAFLAGCKTLSGKGSPPTRTACCVWGGGTRVSNEAYAADTGNHGGHRGRRTSPQSGTASFYACKQTATVCTHRTPTPRKRQGKLREGLPGSSGRGRQGEKRGERGRPSRCLL
jgi:hypothetical protein